MTVNIQERDIMRGLSLWEVLVIAAALVGCTTTNSSPSTPPGMQPAQAAAYCAKLVRAYTEYVGSVTGSLGGTSSGGEAADLDARVAIAQCQDGAYGPAIPVLQQKLRDARVAVPSP
jgi:hypothetical protein